jgi:hypothetical protein
MSLGHMSATLWQGLWTGQFRGTVLRFLPPLPRWERRCFWFHRLMVEQWWKVLKRGEPGESSRKQIKTDTDATLMARTTVYSILVQSTSIFLSDWVGQNFTLPFHLLLLCLLPTFQISHTPLAHTLHPMCTLLTPLNCAYLHRRNLFIDLHHWIGATLRVPQMLSSVNNLVSTAIQKKKHGPG